MTKYWLNNFAIDDFIVSALKEDMYYGDITTDAICANLECSEFNIALKTRTDGVLCGASVFKRVFELLCNDKVKIQFYFEDGDIIKKGDKIASIKGDAHSILTGERLALNFVQKMSGIATYTRKFQDLISKYNVSIVDTRKNTPNFRLFEKYSVKVGGNKLHRFNLSDCVMLKDNHIALYGGSITRAVKEVRKHLSHAHKIEIECDTLEQVREALDNNVDIIMLDNMTCEQMKEACLLINKKAIVEASGCVTFDNVEAIAQTGVDVISTSAIVMKAPTLDLAFDYNAEG
ncbi:MAG: carboxylating nicotinate-nucleotide diphosphorylase [Candidatus Gastranaerophilales bacterium]|nr:carboxylating nicotinate-nucleotide diphosphorylase [Candidatus Gastranaerophilales bacterium]